MTRAFFSMPYSPCPTALKAIRQMTTLVHSLWQLWCIDRLYPGSTGMALCPGVIWRFYGWPLTTGPADLETFSAMTANGRKISDRKTVTVVPYGHWARYRSEEHTSE